MRRNGPPEKSIADHAPRRADGKSNLLVMTCLGAIDGTILLLAASGSLTTWSQALLVGMTIISGAGAWIAAREAFAARLGRHDYTALAGIAAISIAATVAAAWLGVAIGQAVTLHVLPKAIGVVLLLVAADVGGLRLPRPKGAPLPVVAIAAAVLIEGGVQWIP